MPPKPPKISNKLQDEAKGSIAGYIFQFQYALLLLSELNQSDDYVSIEMSDDVSVHDGSDSVLTTIQVKHSIYIDSSIFQDTSKALWRTIQIWIEKLKSGVFSSSTSFNCCSNAIVKDGSIIRKMSTMTFDKFLDELNVLLDSQKTKYAEKRKNSKDGKSIKSTIELIEFAIINYAELRIIKNGLKIIDGINAKDKFLTRIHANTEHLSQEAKDQMYETFYGWIAYQSKYRWMNSNEAIFTKQSFDNKYHLVRSAPAIINAIFRTKKSLATIEGEAIEKQYNEIFVKQIEDMDWRKDLKERKIKEAIIDFIYHDIELKYVIEGGDYTQSDFDDFLDNCKNAWQKVFDKHFCRDLKFYDASQRYGIANLVYNEVMDGLKLEFGEGFHFNTDNSYVCNGAFHKLSNIPEIGWHPEWESKYKK